MAKRESPIEQHEPYLAAACISAHATFIQDGFRQRDVKFMIEMLSNWMDFTFSESALSIHNTQVMRYLNSLLKEGWARPLGRGKQPKYQLTAVGLSGLISKLVNHKPGFPLELFYMIFHFLQTYREPIEALLASETKRLPSAIKIEIDYLLDFKKILESQIRFLEFEIKKLKQRIDDSKAVTQIVKQARAQKKISKDIVKEIEKKFPYDLNSQKPLSEFYEDMPEQIRDFILDIAIEKRTKQIWIPILSVMEEHLKQVHAIKQQWGTN